MTTDEQRQVSLETRAAVMQSLTAHMFARSVALTVFDTSEEPEVAISHGSGFCMAIGGRFFIGTAAHIARQKEDFRIFVAFGEAPNNGVLKNIGWGAEGTDEEFVREDVGWLEISAAAARTSGRTFMTLAEVLPNRNDFPEGFVHTVGSPGDYTEEREFRGRPLTTRRSLPFFSNALAKPETRFVFPETDLYIQWDEHMVRGEPDEKMHRAPDPSGMSGGAVWGSPRLDPSKLWIPSPKLLGVIRSSKHGKYLRATQIQRWLAHG